MSDHDHLRSPGGGGSEAGSSTFAPGRRTLTQGLAPRRGPAAPAPVDPGRDDDDFAAATAGAGAEVPFRTELERSFGMDFSDVRAYFGLADLLDGLGAEAATRGGRIAFAGSAPDRELVAHELAHVAQERRHGPGPVQRKAEAGAEHAAEREADQVAARAARGEPVTVHAAPAAALSRKGKIKPVSGRNPRYYPDQTGKAFAGTVDGRPLMIEDERSPGELREALERNDRAMVAVSITTTSGPKTGFMYLSDLDLGSFVPVVTRGNTRSYVDTAQQFSLTNVSLVERFEPRTRDRPVDLARALDCEPDPEPPQQHEPETGNPDTKGGKDTLFRHLTVVEANPRELIVEFVITTQNRYDRVHYEYRLEGSKESLAFSDDRTWWQNPGWDREEMKRYPFDSKFTHLDPEGTAVVPSTVRHLRARIPRERWDQHFRDDLTQAVHRRIYFALKIWRHDTGPTCSSRTDFNTAYGHPPLLDHNDGYLRGAKDNGLVEYSPQAAEQLGLALPRQLRDEEVWQRPLGPSPSPNVSAPFPVDYGRDQPSFLPLIPGELREGQDIVRDQVGEGALRLATRIENEATLALSRPEHLAQLVQVLTQATRRKGAFNQIMQAGHPKLAGFDWTLTVEGNNVFTDIYLDDPELHALAKGIGIRKRMSRTKGKDVTKLNVKTGPGYNVGKVVSGESRYLELDEKSDIYRRHEIGFDIDRGTRDDQIGEFLEAGVGGHDPWNKAGDEVNQQLDAPMDFTRIRNQMVLQGDRRKFKLQALPRGGTTPINIEISCDHTVGRTWQNFDEDREPDDLFRDLERRYHHRYNIELELEHQGVVIGNGPSSGSSGGTKGQSSERQPRDIQPWQPPEQRQPTPPLEPCRMPERHPGRLYLRRDTESERFNTPSFEIFHHAHDQLIRWMRAVIGDRDGEELGEDRQKLETLRDLVLGDRLPPQEERALPKPRPPRPEPSNITTLSQLGERYTRGFGDGTGLNCLLDTLAQVAKPQVEQVFGSDGEKRRTVLVERMRKRLVEIGFTGNEELLDITDSNVGQTLLAALDLSVMVYRSEGQRVTAYPVLGRSGRPPVAIHYASGPRHYEPLFER